MHRLTFEPARPIDTDSMPWIPTGPGKSFRPLRFAAGSWSELMRLEPGSAVAVHRHTGEVHAFNLTGPGRSSALASGSVQAATSTSRQAPSTDGRPSGDEPCVVHIKVTGAIEYLGENGQVIESITADTQRAVYLNWCREHGVHPAAQILS